MKSICVAAIAVAASAQPWKGFPSRQLFNAAEQGLTMPAVGLGTVRRGVARTVNVLYGYRFAGCPAGRIPRVRGACT